MHNINRFYFLLSIYQTLVRLEFVAFQIQNILSSPLDYSGYMEPAYSATSKHNSFYVNSTS